MRVMHGTHVEHMPCREGNAVEKIPRTLGGFVERLSTSLTADVKQLLPLKNVQLLLFGLKLLPWERNRKCKKRRNYFFVGV